MTASPSETIHSHIGLMFAILAARIHALRSCKRDVIGRRIVQYAQSPRGSLGILLAPIIFWSTIVPISAARP